ncbi:phage portal protein [Holospora curviuscula]|uniref:Phage portal protein n=1 Tax=Holospora curviuscula TaxID=1082868 RepID=A0A2S5R767_9PROT|nr:phage portal protein [Holospora curviuscula]PPE03179.1 Phage portal protein [Holospora curviuscula]
MKFFKKKPLEKKAVSTPFLTTSSNYGYSGKEHTFEEMAALGYQNNPIVYRCITLIARSIASVQIHLKKKLSDTRITHHPIISLLNNPNPFQRYESFTEMVVSHLLLSGNAFIEYVGDASSCGELYILRPDHVRILYTNQGFPETYEYQIGNTTHHIPIDGLTGRSQIVHISLFNPFENHWGQSPLMAAMPLVQFRNEALDHNLSILKRGGNPSGVLTVDSQYEMTEEQRIQLRTDLENLYTGRDNAGRIMVLSNGLRWEKTGFSPQEMAFLEGQGEAARGIAQLFGIPPTCIGIPGDERFANYKEARVHMWEETLIPMVNLILSNYQKLLSILDKEVELSYSKDDIDALSIKREALWERTNNAAFLTINEKRRIMGFTPLPDGDVLVAA